MPDRRYRKLPPSAWLRALHDPQAKIRLLVCRYQRRSGTFRSYDLPVQENIITFVEQGALRALFDEQRFLTQPGEAICAPPGGFRRYESSEPAQHSRFYNLRFTVTLRGRPMSWLPAPRVLSGVWEIQPVLQQLHDLYLSPGAHADARLRGLLMVLSTSLLEHADDGTSSRRTLRPAQRQRLNRFIDDHLAEAIAPADLARECELSLDYFSRIFRRTYGVAPRTWLIRERMRQAATRLVETDRTVAQVAHEFGVDNLSLFCRQFRSVMGCTPTVYRAGRGAAE